MFLSVALAAQSQDEPGLDSPTEEVTDSASSMLEGFLETLPRLGIALAVVVLAWIVSRVVRMILFRALDGHQTPSFQRVMSKLGGWLVFGLGVLIAMTVAFPSVKPVDLLAGLGIFSVAVGFAFQDILENTLAGVLLLFRQPFESGDQIDVQGQQGTVEAITIRETRMKTFDGRMVIIPNRDVYKSVIVVQTHYEVRRLNFVVGVAYENDADEARQVVVDALASVDGIRSDPAPEALINQLNVSTVDIDARFWTDAPQHNARVVLDKAIRAVKDALDAKGIEMPADIIALQATPSFKAALQNEAEVTPAGSVISG